MQPRMRRSTTCHKSETIDRHTTLTRRHSQIDQQRRAALSPKNFVKPHDPTIAWDEFVTGLFPQFYENRIERRILKFLRDDRAFQIEKTTGETEPFEVAVVVTGDHQ